MDHRCLPPAGECFQPDYAGGSIVNLMSSIAAALGANVPGSVPLRDAGLDALVRARRRVVLLVVDGLGYHRLLAAAAARGALCSHLRGSLTSVFPSTTASAVTTFLTGLAPAQHGLTGWHMWFPAHETVGAILPYRTRVGDRPLTALGIEPGQMFSYPSFFARLPVRTFSVAPARIAASVFNRHHCRGAEIRGYDSIEHLFDLTLGCLRMSADPCYVYAYYADYDSVAHEHGVDSRQCDHLLRRVDELLGVLLARARDLDATVIVTADHGFVDSPPSHVIELEAHPRIRALLRAPLCGERRAAYCYLRPGAAEAFEQIVGAELAGRAWACPSETLIDSGWFGPPPHHRELLARTGDYTLLMRDRWTIKEWLPGEERHRQLGVHGGVSQAEMTVPLVIAQP